VERRGIVQRLKTATQGITGAVDYTKATAYRRPPALYRRMQWLGVVIVSLGLVPKTVVVLEVRGRRSGRLRRSVVVRTPHKGEQYLVALAGESEWVRNVRAAGGLAVIRHGRSRTQVQLLELSRQERPAIIWDYLHRPGWSSPSSEARHYFGVRPEASLNEISAVVDRYPVFRISVA
jgi:deazaflavin-dependent oxidoreductase (nitroreductase family)